MGGYVSTNALRAAPGNFDQFSVSTSLSFFIPEEKKKLSFHALVNS